MENGVESRWEPCVEQYRAALKIGNAGQQQQLKQQMLETAKERVFYLTTLTHHAGKYLIVLLDRVFVSTYKNNLRIPCILLYAYELCVIGGQKQASRVSKLTELKSFWLSIATFNPRMGTGRCPS